jgi:hypothetical protein
LHVVLVDNTRSDRLVSNGQAATNNVLIAVSKTSNPLSGWTALTLSSDGSATTSYATSVALGLDATPLTSPWIWLRWAARRRARRTCTRSRWPACSRRRLARETTRSFPAWAEGSGCSRSSTWQPPRRPPRRFCPWIPSSATPPTFSRSPARPRPTPRSAGQRGPHFHQRLADGQHL